MNLPSLSLHRLLAVASVLSLSVASSAFADVDAGTTDAVTPVSDATATSADATTSDVATDVSVSPDVAVPPDGGGSFSADPCWDAKCPAETAACKGDPDCVKMSGCFDTGDQTCLQSYQGKPAAKELDALQKCGWGKCTDPNAGSCKAICGKFVSKDPCHCDDACKTYGDCCKDYDTLCGLGTCAKADCSDGSTGEYLDGTANSCECGSSCESNQNCCGDYDTTCKGKTPACVPACKNKDGTAKVCGPDGCGSTCGMCPAGQKCTTGACTGTTGADASGSGDTGGSADVGGGADDAAIGADGTTGGTADTGATTGTPAASGGAAKSSGCTAGSTGNGSFGWASALLGMGFVVAMRRRRA